MDTSASTSDQRSSSAISLGRSLALSAVVLLLIVTGIATYRRTDRRVPEATRAAPTADALAVQWRDEPLRISPFVPEITLSHDWESIDEISKRMWPRRKASMGEVVHALHAFEPGCEPPPGDEYPTREELLAVVLDPAANREWFDGQTSLIETSEGLRYTASRGTFQAAVAHDDQVLSLLGELGIPLGHPLETVAGPRTVRDVFGDAVANFHPGGEIEFSAAALIHYLPPQKSWRNKIEMDFDFDALTKLLLTRSFGETSCLGTHDLYALVLLLRADQSHQLLSSPTRGMVSEFLAKTVELVVRSQGSDGSLGVDWCEELWAQAWYWTIAERCFPESEQQVARMREIHVAAHDDDRTEEPTEARPVDTRTRRVYATGHHLEWIVILPRDRQPEPVIIRDAVEFCLRALEDASDDEVRHDFCAFSHAAHMMRQFGMASRGEVSIPDAEHVTDARDSRRSATANVGFSSRTRPLAIGGCDAMAETAETIVASAGDQVGDPLAISSVCSLLSTR